MSSEPTPRPRIAPATPPAWPPTDPSLLDVSVDEDDSASVVSAIPSSRAALGRPVISHHRSTDGMLYTVEREPGHPSTAVAAAAAAATSSGISGGASTITPHTVASHPHQRAHSTGVKAANPRRPPMARTALGAEAPRNPAVPAQVDLARPEPLSSIFIQRKLADLAPSDAPRRLPLATDAMSQTSGDGSALTAGPRYSRLVSIAGESGPTGNVPTGSRGRRVAPGSGSAPSSPDRPAKPRKARALHPSRQAAPRMTGRTLESQIAAVPVVDIMSQYDPSMQRDTFVKSRPRDTPPPKLSELGTDYSFRVTQKMLGWDPPMLLQPHNRQNPPH
eukprot:m.28772 g.28772  ORF g.28772 m.28772 type:complete len:333 (+) comp6594_c0_seq1:154-1152(+)